MPPKTPQERVEATRKAFAATMTDPGFLADAKQARLEIAPLTAEDIAGIIGKTFSAPPDVLATAKGAMD